MLDMLLHRSHPLRRLAGLALALALCAPAAEAQQAGSLLVRLASAPDGGRVRLLLFDSDVTFGRFGDPLRAAVFPAGRQSYGLTDVPPGVYALVVHHDENGNGEFDKNFIGIPREPIAISRGYRPKGPPVYARASFPLSAGEERVFELELEPVLGPRGIFSVGVGVLGRSSPYVGGDAGVFQGIPAITYNGERLQWFGPSLRYGLAGNDRLRLAATARYRLRAYEEDDDRALAGLGDRRDTMLAGLALVSELPLGLDLSLGYEHDVLDRIGGGTGRLALSRSFQWNIARLSPSVGLNWTSSDLADHDFGVPGSAATAERPAYGVDDVWTAEVGLRSFIELSDAWRIVLDVGVELLPDEVTDSPIVDEDLVVKGFFALTYAF